MTPEGKAMKLIRRQLLRFAGATVPALGVNASSWGAEPSIVGNWKLVSAVSEELATGKKTALLGEHPKGYFIYAPQGRMMGLVVHETRTPPKVDKDGINLHKYMYAYSGRYTVEGEKVVHHVDVSWNESWAGTDQIRFFKLEGDSPHAQGRPTKERDHWNRKHFRFYLGTGALNLVRKSSVSSNPVTRKNQQRPAN
jgi:hypothetical protein